MRFSLACYAFCLHARALIDAPSCNVTATSFRDITIQTWNFMSVRRNTCSTLFWSKCFYQLSLGSFMHFQSPGSSAGNWGLLVASVSPQAVDAYCQKMWVVTQESVTKSLSWAHNCVHTGTFETCACAMLDSVSLGTVKVTCLRPHLMCNEMEHNCFKVTLQTGSQTGMEVFTACFAICLWTELVVLFISFDSESWLCPLWGIYFSGYATFPWRPLFLSMASCSHSSALRFWRNL